MADTIFSSTIANALKTTLDQVIVDPTDGYDTGAIMHRWMHERTMTDNWHDDLESGGPGLAAEKAEGSEMAQGTIREGVVTRYNSRTFALKIVITEETMEDNKYDKIVNAARRLKRAMWKTVDIDATNVLVRAWDTNYVGGDGLPLASASHTLPHGGTFSNLMATPMSPSRASVIVATSAMRKLPGHDGITEGYEPMKVIFPTEQWAVWDGLVGSEFAPEAGNFAEINVVNRMKLTPVPVKYWTNTTTNYGYCSDNDDKVNWLWRRKPKSRSWVDNDQMLMKYGISARWSRGWSDPRAFYGVQA